VCAEYAVSRKADGLGLARDYAARDERPKESFVTEAEWLAATDSLPMLEYLRGGAITARKRRLFACGCCRLIWPLLVSAEWRRAVEIAAQVADGRATDAERRVAVTDAEPWRGCFTDPPLELLHPTDRDVVHHPTEAARRATYHDASHANTVAAAVHAAIADAAIRPRQAALLRELVGNPFRRPVSPDLQRLGPTNSSVREVAAAAYESREVLRLAILADALEDAGCTDAELLGHLRGPGPHVRGCWAVDLVLGKR
jgi:hypothetical protein